MNRQRIKRQFEVSTESIAQALTDMKQLIEEQNANIAYLEAEYHALYKYNKSLYDYILKKTGSPPPDELLPGDDTTGLLSKWQELERKNERKHE